jgi:type IV secretory pathway VirJ component
MTPGLAILFAVLFQLPPAATAPAVPAAAAAEELLYGRFGQLPVHRPAGPPSQVVLLLSGDPAGPEAAKMAGELSSWGALVLVVDAQHYLATTEKSAAKCTYPAADFEALAHYAEQKLSLPRYVPPLLLADGTAAIATTLAYVTLAQAPPGTFQGAVTAGFCPAIEVHRPFCPGHDLLTDRKWAGSGVKLEPATALEDPWLLLPGPACPAGNARDFAAAISRAKPIGPPEGAPASGGGIDPILLRQAFDHFGDAQKAAEAAATALGDVGDLPLLELPASGGAARKAKGKEIDAFAVILSGDGGWVGLDRRIGLRLADLSVPVVGLDSLKYFWVPRDPEGAARDLARILEHYFKAWEKGRAILVGYSQGADVLPFLVSRLPPELRQRVALVTLVGTDANATFDFDFAGFMSDQPKRPDLPVLPEIPRLQGTRLLCISSNAEPDSPCRHLPKGLAVTLAVDGGHGYNRGVNIVTDRILKEAGLRPKNAPAPKGAPRPKPGQ